MVRRLEAHIHRLPLLRRDGSHSRSHHRNLGRRLLALPPRRLADAGIIRRLPLRRRQRWTRHRVELHPHRQALRRAAARDLPQRRNDAVALDVGHRPPDNLRMDA